MKNSNKIRKETLLKITTAFVTLFLAIVGFFVFNNYNDSRQLTNSLIIIFFLFLLCTLSNILISFHSLRQTEDCFKEREQLHEKISNLSSQGIFLTNPKGIIIDLNMKAQSWFFDGPEDIKGKTIFRNIDCDLKTGKNVSIVFFNDMGSHFQAEIQIRTIDYENSKHFVIYIEDNSERIKRETFLKKMASEDPLTGLLNRRSFLHELNKEIERSSRIGLTCTIVLIDLDHFKKINDTYGHDFGDEVLVAFSSILKRNSRQLDILCRYGGEEFVLLFPHTDLENSMNILERIKDDFADFPYSYNIRPTFSGGAIITELKGDTVDVNLLLKEVDILLYKAKENGRNRIETKKNRKMKLIRVS